MINQALKAKKTPINEFEKKINYIDFNKDLEHQIFILAQYSQYKK